MKKVFLVFLFYNPIFLFSQAPNIEWQKTIGGSERDDIEYILQTTDGGYIFGGYSASDVTGDKKEPNRGGGDYWVVKLDEIGNIEWQKTIGGNKSDVLKEIKQTTDGGYILGGYSNSDKSGDKAEDNQISTNLFGSVDYWVVKLDATGNIEWENTIGGNQYDYLESIEQATDGGYMLGGFSISEISGDKTIANKGSYDFWIVKLNATGNIEWQKTIGGNGEDQLHSIHHTTDGGYILGGVSISGATGDKTEGNIGNLDYWVVKINSTGTLEWDNTIGGNKADWLGSIEQTLDGGYILGGFSWSDISGDKTENNIDWKDYWIVKLNSTGTIEWQNTIGGEDFEDLYSVKQTLDGGYIVGGFSDSKNSGDKTEDNRGYMDFWVVRLNKDGNIVWDKTIGGNENDYLYSVEQTTDGGYLLGGYSRSDISGDKTEGNKGDFDCWIVKLAADDLAIGNELIEFNQNTFTVLSAYPNPFNPSTTITYGLNTDSEILVQVYDISGKQINTLLNSYQKQGWHSIEWNGTDYNNNQVPAGIYLSRIKSNNQVRTIKLMLLK